MCILFLRFYLQRFMKWLYLVSFCLYVIELNNFVEFFLQKLFLVQMGSEKIEQMEI